MSSYSYQPNSQFIILSCVGLWENTVLLKCCRPRSLAHSSYVCTVYLYPGRGGEGGESVACAINNIFIMSLASLSILLYCTLSLLHQLPSFYCRNNLLMDILSPDMTLYQQYAPSNPVHRSRWDEAFWMSSVVQAFQSSCIKTYWKTPNISIEVIKNSHREVASTTKGASFLTYSFYSACLKNTLFKGTVARDFTALVFFIKSVHLGPCFIS
jgi:hypothetical protein